MAEAVSIFAILLLTGFFVYHQSQNTGFFTSSFGMFETILFYLPVPIAVAVSLIRMATAKRNTARPLEALGAVAWAAAGIWLFIVFPFDFTHLGDALPNGTQFLLSWVPNWLGRALVLIAGLAGAVNMVYTPIIYFSVRKEISRHAPLPR